MALSITKLGIQGLEDVEQIGTGGSSRVYRARQADLDRVVAVKVLNAGHERDVARRFDRERKAMGRLSLHEGIVPVYSTGETTFGEPYLVMPYYHNGSLQDQIDSGPLDWRSAVAYVDAAAETIATAHDAGVVHLDLKPANIMLNDGGAPRIADFGIAKLLAAGKAVNTGKTTGTAFTPAYSAPETFLDGEVGPASDVYGLGATLWALLAGHPPFLPPDGDNNLMAVIGRVVNSPVGDLRQTAPGAICDVIERAMAKHPHDRYQSAREFHSALRGAVDRAAGVAPADAGTKLFPAAAAVPGVADAGATQTLASGPDPVELPPSLASTVSGPAAPPAPPSRSLLQETAQPLAAPTGHPPSAPGPIFDIDRFHPWPILLGVLASIAVVGVGALAVTRGGNDDPLLDPEASVPAAPTTGASSSSTAGTTVLGQGGSIDGSSSSLIDSSTSAPPTTPAPTTIATTAATTPSTTAPPTTATTVSTTTEPPSTTATTVETTTTEPSSTTTEDTSTSTTDTTTPTTDPTTSSTDDDTTTTEDTSTTIDSSLPPVG